MSWKLDQNGPHYNRESTQYETYSSNSNSRKFKDSNCEDFTGSTMRGRNNEVHDRQGWSKSPRFNHANSDSDDEYRSFSSNGYRNYNNKKIFGGLFGGSSKPKILPPYQTVMLRVRTQCAECVRKVKTAVAHLDGVESINVDMNQKRLTVKGYVDPQNVLRKASKTGKSVELVNSKAYGTNISPYEQQYGSKDTSRASSDSYQQSNGHKHKQDSSLDNYQQSSGGRNKISAGNGQNSKGVKFNATSDNDQRYDRNDFEHGISSKPRKTSEYDRYGSPDAYRSNSEQRQSSNGQSSRQASDFYQKTNHSKLSQKIDRQSTEDRLRPNLVYPASRDDGSYIFSDENANNCSIM